MVGLNIIIEYYIGLISAFNCFIFSVMYCVETDRQIECFLLANLKQTKYYELVNVRQLKYLCLSVNFQAVTVESISCI